MPNFSGVWTLSEQLQAVSDTNWTGIALPELLYRSGQSTFSGSGNVCVATLWEVGDDWCSICGNRATATSGGDVFIGIKNDNTMWTWGANDEGALGLGDINNRSYPVQVGALTTWCHVSMTTGTGAAIKTDGTLWTWGTNEWGKTAQNRSSGIQLACSPVQVGSCTNWAMVEGKHCHLHAIKTDGTLWGWGRQQNGEIGDNYRTTSRSSPVQIGALTTWTCVSSGTYHTLALKSDGTLWSWGNRVYGELGDNFGGIYGTTWRQQPFQVGALTTWCHVSAGGPLKGTPNCTYGRHSLAIKTDNTMWSWGMATCSAIGDGSSTGRSSPVQIGSGVNWIYASAGSQNNVAIADDGTAWTWGDGVCGKTGLGTTASCNVPTCTGSTKWKCAQAAPRLTIFVQQPVTN